MRVIARLVVNHSMVAVMAWREAFDGDVVGSIAWPTTDLANTEYVFSDPRLLKAYVAGQFSDADRRPISVRALGAGVGMDVETVRRGARRLVDMGYCELRPEGLIVRSEAYGRAAIEAAWTSTMRSLSATFRSLESYAGPQMLDQSPVIRSRPWEGQASASTPTARLYGLLYAEYILRFAIENLSLFRNNTLHADVFNCIINESTRPLVEDEVAAKRYGYSGAVLPDEQRPAISVRGIAGHLGYPVETTRRHVNALMALGYVAKRADGVIVPAEVMTRPEFLKLVANVSSWLFAMTRKMDRLASDLEATGLS